MKIYEAYKDFSFRNIDNGLMVYVKTGDRYFVKEISHVDDKIRIVSEDGLTDTWIAILAFATHFMEAKNVK